MVLRTVTIKLDKANGVHSQLSFQLTVQPSAPSIFFQRPTLHSVSSLSTSPLHVLDDIT